MLQIVCLSWYDFRLLYTKKHFKLLTLNFYKIKYKAYKSSFHAWNLKPEFSCKQVLIFLTIFIYKQL